MLSYWCLRHERNKKHPDFIRSPRRILPDICNVSSMWYRWRVLHVSFQPCLAILSYSSPSMPDSDYSIRESADVYIILPEAAS